MTTLRITDCLTIELRLFGLIGAFNYEKNRISYIASAIFVLVMCLMGIQHTMTIVYLETPDQLTELMYVFGIYIVACFKLYGLIENRDTLTSILDGLNEKLMLPSNHLYRDEFLKTLRHIRMSSRFFTYLVYMAIVTTVCTNIFNQKMLFYCYFPFETRYAYSLQGYWLAYSYQIFYGLYVIKTNISIDILTMALLHCAAVKFKVMRYECEKLCTYSNCIENINAIKNAVIFHNDSVRYVENIVKVFSLGLFVQCFLSGVSICIILLKAILLDVFTQVEQFVVAVIVLVSYICQIFFYCHYGNQIKHQSEKLFTSIYLCKWYDLNCNCFINGGNSKRNHVVAIKRSISIMLERTKAPIIVIAGRLIILSYDSYIMICKSGYQFFAVLRDILK